MVFKNSRYVKMDCSIFRWLIMFTAVFVDKTQISEDLKFETQINQGFSFVDFLP